MLKTVLGIKESTIIKCLKYVARYNDSYGIKEMASPYVAVLPSTEIGQYIKDVASEFESHSADIKFSIETLIAEIRIIRANRKNAAGSSYVTHNLDIPPHVLIAIRKLVGLTYTILNDKIVPRKEAYNHNMKVLKDRFDKCVHSTDFDLIFTGLIADKISFRDYVRSVKYELESQDYLHMGLFLFGNQIMWMERYEDSVRFMEKLAGLTLAQEDFPQFKTSVSPVVFETKDNANIADVEESTSAETME